MSDGATVWIWTAAILAGSVGFAAGFLVAYLAVLRDKDAGSLREQLARQKQEFDAHRSRVDDHFVRTSELFQDMTRHYGALYEHLANGAQSLCSDRLVTHRPQVPENIPMVEHKRDPAAPATDAPAAPEPASDQTAASEPDTGAATTSKAEAATRPAAQHRSAERPQASAAAVDDSELESFAPRPEAAALHDSALQPERDQAAPATEAPEVDRKPHLH